MYYSINYGNYDVGYQVWSRTHTARTYSTILPPDRTPQLVHNDRKVFLSEDDLRDMQTEFGFDEDFDVDIPYRNRPAAHRHGISLGSSGKNSAQDPRQAPITQYFEKQSMSTSTSALRGIPVSTSHSSATARDDTADEVDSDDEYISEFEDDEEAR